ncbi:MAG: BrnA antitoxin family protein [Burkholderiales bacterium]
MKKQPISRKTRKISRTNPEWTEAMIAKARPAREVLPKLFGARTAANMLKPRGRPKSAESKVAISLRLSPDTLARWKATGPGWQTRMANVLRESV